MTKKTTNYLIICGESSADHYGADLAIALKNRPNTTVFSIGGPKLMGVTQQLLAMDISTHSVDYDHWNHQRHIRKQLNHSIPTFITEYAIDKIIIVDFPKYNFIIADIVQSCHVPISTFITPNFWIWKDIKSAKKLIQYSDTIITIFQKEYLFYSELDAKKVHYFGHPLTLTADNSNTKQPTDTENKRIGIYPGSRLSEIKYHLPIMCQVIIQLQSRQFIEPIIHCSNASLIPIIQQILTRFSLNIPIESSPALPIAIALTAPGTNTLKLVIQNIPMVIFGRLSWFSYFVAKYIVRLRLPFVGLPNIISGRQICPEYIQNETPLSQIVDDLESLINHQKNKDDMIDHYIALVDSISAQKDYFDQVASIL